MLFFSIYDENNEVIAENRFRTVASSGACGFFSTPQFWNEAQKYDSLLFFRSTKLSTYFFKLFYDIQWFVPIHVGVLTVCVLVSIFNLSFFSVVGASKYS